jgi:3-phenylpropionate/trans-cinnamate dioxygenase ferredoxin reductase component
MDDIVIVGAGLAAANAVETLRAEGYEGRLTLVGSEPLLPYERPQLSKERLKGAEFALLHDAAWYAEHDAVARTSTTVTALDLAGGAVVLDGGERLRFDAVLLATGAAPRVPDLTGVEQALQLRTAADAERLLQAFEPGSRLVLVGGGWIGLEVAAAARGAGLEVTVLERGDLPLRRVLGPTLAGHLTQLHRDHGVDVRTGVTTTAITAGGVETSAGLVPADQVLVAVGAVPRITLAEAADLAVDGGIVVDERLRASDPRVLAAGDVALARHTTYGPLRVEHWDNAIRQGQLAARSMLGQDTVYDWAPYFFTDQFEFSMEYVGHSSPDDEVVVRGDLAANEFVAYWLRDGVVTAGMNVNVWDVNDRLRELVGTRVDPAQLTDLR